MRAADLLKLAWDNLWRNRGRSVLTLVGVMIGVAALLTLLAYGSGLQQNARQEFNALELYNTFRVTSSPNPISGPGDLAFQMQQDRPDTAEAVPLTDSLIADIEAIDGVRVAYPEIGFPSQVIANDRTIIANAEAIPMAFGDIAAYQPEVGRFFTSPADSALLISQSMAERLGFDDPAAAVGDTVTLRTATLDFAALQNPGALLARGLSALPLQEVDYAMRVAGLLPESQQPVSGFTRVLVPIQRAEQMEKVTFFSTLDLLLRSGPTEGYAALRVQLDDASQHAQVRQQIEGLGVYATSFREQFDRLEQLFLIMDLALAIIGIIALVIATIGIANTVMMNVRERYREIGVMKAIGGDERDLQRLFVLESGLLGVGGSLAGLTFGWVIVLAMDAAVNAYLQQQGFPPISVFRATVPMALGILAVAVSISLAAGIVPARRAARVEPVEALRSV